MENEKEKIIDLMKGMVAENRGSSGNAIYDGIIRMVDEGIREEERRSGTTYVYLTKDLLTKIEIGCRMGFDARQIALFSGIRMKKLEKLVEKYPLLREHMYIWGSEVVGEAKKNIYKAVKNGDIGVSQWVLERLARGEYGKHSSVEITHDSVVGRKRVDLEEIKEARNRIGIVEGEVEGSASYEELEVEKMSLTESDKNNSIK